MTDIFYIGGVAIAVIWVMAVVYYCLRYCGRDSDSEAHCLDTDSIV